MFKILYTSICYANRTIQMKQAPPPPEKKKEKLIELLSLNDEITYKRTIGVGTNKLLWKDQRMEEGMTKKNCRDNSIKKLP